MYISDATLWYSSYYMFVCLDVYVTIATFVLFTFFLLHCVMVGNGHLKCITSTSVLPENSLRRVNHSLVM